MQQPDCLTVPLACAGTLSEQADALLWPGTTLERRKALRRLAAQTVRMVEYGLPYGDSLPYDSDASPVEDESSEQDEILNQTYQLTEDERDYLRSLIEELDHDSEPDLMQPCGSGWRRRSTVPDEYDPQWDDTIRIIERGD